MSTDAMLVSPVAKRIKPVVARLRDARQRLRLGLPITDELDALLDTSAELLEECEDAAQAVFAFETQVGEAMAGRKSAGVDRKLDARLAELRAEAARRGGEEGAR